MNLNVKKYSLLNNKSVVICYFKEINESIVFINDKKVEPTNGVIYDENDELKINKETLYFNNNKVKENKDAIKKYTYTTKLKTYNVEYISTQDSPLIKINVNGVCVYHDNKKEIIELSFENQKIELKKEKILNKINTYSIKANAKEKDYFIEDKNILEAAEIFNKKMKKISFFTYLKNMMVEGCIISLLLAIVFDLEICLRYESILKINIGLQILIFIGLLLISFTLYLIAKLIRFIKNKKN